MGAQRPRLILAYLIVGMAGLALFGGLTRSKTAVGLGVGLGWCAAMLHAITFFARSRRRRQPAELAGAGRTILAATLGVMAASSLANVIAVAVAMDRPQVSGADGGAAAAWAIVTLVLCWRAWLVPSARRAAVLQLCALWIATPAMMFTVIDAGRYGRVSDGSVAGLTATLVVAFVIISLSGAVLDKLFAALHDRGNDVVPKAIVMTVVLAALAGAGCKTVAKGEHFEEELAEHFATKGYKVAVTCPDRIPLAHVETNRFRCDVVATDGSSVTVAVQLDGEGQFRIQPVDGTDRPPSRAPDVPVRRDDDGDGDPWN